MSNPPSAPAEAPKPTASPAAAPEVKITLKAKDELADLKEQLGVKADETAKQEEWKVIEAKFAENKDKIKEISQKSRDTLKKDIEDPDNKINGVLDVNADGELVFNETKADAEAAKPEEKIKKDVKELILVDMSAKISDETQKNIAELKTQDKPRWYAFVEMLSKIPFIGSFFTGFL